MLLVVFFVSLFCSTSGEESSNLVQVQAARPRSHSRPRPHSYSIPGECRPPIQSSTGPGWFNIWDGSELPERAANTIVSTINLVSSNYPFNREEFKDPMLRLEQDLLAGVKDGLNEVLSRIKPCVLNNARPFGPYNQCDISKLTGIASATIDWIMNGVSIEKPFHRVEFRYAVQALKNTLRTRVETEVKVALSMIKPCVLK